MNKIRLAILGFGHIGKQHASAILANPSCELVAVCDTDPAKKNELAAFGPVTFFENPGDVCKPGLPIDIICVTSPNGLHARHAEMALLSGYHVLIEKPMALRESDCAQLIELAHKQKREIFCVMQNRFSPLAIWLKDALRREWLGAISLVQINCYWNRDERYYGNSGWHGDLELDGGPLYTQFAHFIDTLYWLLGDIKNIDARFYNFTHQGSIEFEDTGIINFEMVAGGAGGLTYTTSVWHRNMESSFSLIGTKGAIKVTGQYFDQLEYCHIKDQVVPQLSPASKSGHSQILENIVEVLQNQKKVAIPAQEAKAVVGIIEQIYKMRPAWVRCSRNV